MQLFGDWQELREAVGFEAAADNRAARLDHIHPRSADDGVFKLVVGVNLRVPEMPDLHQRVAAADVPAELPPGLTVPPCIDGHQLQWEIHGRKRQGQ